MMGIAGIAIAIAELNPSTFAPNEEPDMRLHTLAVRGPGPRKADGPVAPSIVPAVSFQNDSRSGAQAAHFYSIFGNPNREALEDTLRGLEGGHRCFAFSSGSAATAAVIQAVACGRHIVAPKDAFHGTARLLREFGAPWQVSTTFVDMQDLESLASAIRSDTALILTETPTNPMLRIFDIAAISEIAKARGITLAVDNTWCTALLQRPLELGADLVLHSTTKYIGGHGDLVGGAVVSARPSAFDEGIRRFQQYIGASPSAFDCWLLQRSLQTLPCRLSTQCTSALRLARFLHEHPRVVKVHYPGLPHHPGHDIAAKQMSAFGGMLSFELEGKRQVNPLLSSLALWVQATSMGSAVSLIEHRADSPIQNIGQGSGFQVPPGLVRLSVGVEDPLDLIEDLEQGLEALAS